MSLRAAWRAVALAIALVICVIRFWLMKLSGPMTLERRALWIQDASRVILKSMGVHYRLHGTPPRRGLVVANHLSYVDVLVLGAAMPSFFVAKIEIGSWPFFGMTTRMGGTIFVDRGSLDSAKSVAEQMKERLKLEIPVPVMLFPEGTSTDGREVLRFHSRLIDPATSLGAPITAAAIRYVLEGGGEERELCWHDDMLFVTHLWKVLGTVGFSAEVTFGEPHVYTDRREAADATHDEVVAMRAGTNRGAEDVVPVMR